VAIRILDLFCGMGGLSLGFALGIGNAEVVGYDKDRAAVETYNLNLSRFGCKAYVKDLLKFTPEGGFDMVVGGPPCQPFSIAVNPKTGKVGEGHPLYPTFPRFFDIILELRPKVFLMENVKGLATRRHSHLFEGQLRRLGDEYAVKWGILNAAFYGVPQRRERLFVVGIRRDLGIRPSLPEPTHAEEEGVTLTGKLHKWVSVREAIGDLLPSPTLVKASHNGGKGVATASEDPSFTFGTFSGSGRSRTAVYVAEILPPRAVERIRKEREDSSRHFARMEFPDSLEKPSRTVSSHTAEGSKRETIVLPLMVVVAGRGDVREYGEGLALTIMDIGAGDPRQGRPLVLEQPSTTIQCDPRLLPPDHHHLRRLYYRRLTPKECLRLQSFPDWWSFPSHLSKSAIYRLVGEAVPPILAYRLAIHLGKLLGLAVVEPPDPAGFRLPYFGRAFADYFAGGWPEWI